eukprot:150260-Prymnesium_polylepis.1
MSEMLFGPSGARRWSASTVELTANRMPRTDAPTEAEQDTIDRDNVHDDRHAQQAIGIPAAL